MPSWLNRTVGNHQNGGGYGNRNGYSNGQSNTRNPQNNMPQSENAGRPYLNNPFALRLFANNNSNSNANNPTGRPPTRSANPVNPTHAMNPMNNRSSMNQVRPPNPQGNGFMNQRPNQGQAQNQAQRTQGRDRPLASPANMPTNQSGNNQNNANRNSNQNPTNKPLPDGVRYEPLDETTKNLMNQLKIPGSNPAAQPVPAAGAAPTDRPSAFDYNGATVENTPSAGNTFEAFHDTPAPVSTSIAFASKSETPGIFPQGHQQDLSRKIEEFIQNERNASLFYGYLARHAGREDYKRALEDISRESGKRPEVYNSIYRSYTGQEYVPKETEIDNTVSFQNGVARAIVEESKALREMSDVYMQVADEKTARSVSGLIYKKICDVNILQIMNTNRGLYY